MAGSVNKVLLIGNLGRDPEVRHNQAGDPIANLNIATSESWKDRNTGERRERTEWHRIVVFGPLAKVAQQYLRKGSKVYVEGQLQTRKWTDQSGQDRYATEVVLNPYRGQLALLDRREGGGQQPRENNGYGARPDDWQAPAGGFGGTTASSGGFGGSSASPDNTSFDLDDEIPF